MTTTTTTPSEPTGIKHIRLWIDGEVALVGRYADMDSFWTTIWKMYGGRIDRDNCRVYSAYGGTAFTDVYHGKTQLEMVVEKGNAQL